MPIEQAEPVAERQRAALGPDAVGTRGEAEVREEAEVVDAQERLGS